MENEQKPDFGEVLRGFIVRRARDGETGEGEVIQTEEGFVFKTRFDRQAITELQEAAHFPTNQRVYGQIRQLATEGEVSASTRNGVPFEDDQKLYNALQEGRTINIAVRISSEDFD